MVCISGFFYFPFELRITLDIKPDQNVLICKAIIKKKHTVNITLDINVLIEQC